MSLTVKMMGTIVLITIIIAAFVTGSSDSWIAGTIVAVSILLLESVGYISLIIFPLWKYKSTGKITLPLDNWQGKSLQFWYGENDQDISWRFAMIQEPKYNSLCYLGSCIWLSAHLYVILSAFILLYRRILTPIGHGFCLFYDRVLTPLGRLANKPLLPSLPWWMAILFGFLFTYAVILPDFRRTEATIVLRITGIGLALGAILWIIYGICVWFTETDFRSYFTSLKDPEGDLWQKYWFWFGVLWVTILLLSPLAWWYNSTILVLWSILSVIWLIVLVAMMASTIVVTLTNELAIREKTFACVIYALFYGGWLWFCYYHPLISAVIDEVNIFLVIIPTVVILGTVIYKSLRKLTLTITDNIRNRRQAAIPQIAPSESDKPRPKAKKSRLASDRIEVQPKSQGQSWWRFFSLVIIWLIIWVMYVIFYTYLIIHHNMGWGGWIGLIIWGFYLLPSWTIRSLRKAAAGLTFPNKIADWADRTHENLENLESKVCPLVVPHFAGKNPAILLEIINKYGQSFTECGLTQSIGHTLDDLIKNDLHLGDYNISYNDVADLQHINKVNRIEVDDSYVIQDEDVIKITLMPWAKPLSAPVISHFI